MKTPGTRSWITPRFLYRAAAAAALLYLLLLIPAPERPVPAGANQTPFAWNRDAFWSSLEAQFQQARSLGCEALTERIGSLFSDLGRSLEVVAAGRLAPGDPGFGLLETNLFELAPMVAACPKRLPEFARIFTRARNEVKKQSEYFETQEPSDLEYDPQLGVVAEWRDPETLFQDHADNAVIDAMLEEADTGQRLDYPRFTLPWARLAKGYSVILNLFGRVGPVPEGMSATAALRNQAFTRRHAAIKANLLARADDFRKKNGYTPPYWELVALARGESRSRP